MQGPSSLSRPKTGVQRTHIAYKEKFEKILWNFILSEESFYH